VCQAPPRRLEVLAREEVGDAGDPGIGRLVDDDVVELAPGLQEVAAVVDDEADFWVGADVEVVFSEELGGVEDIG